MDYGTRVEAKGMDEFVGEVVKAGYIEGLLTASQAASEKPTPTQQLLLIWRPLDTEEGEVKDQPAWYGMGGRGFTFTGDVVMYPMGKDKEERALYPEINDPENAPDITDTSWLGLLLDRCNKLGFIPKGTDANAFLGLKAQVKRERYCDVASAFLTEHDREARGTLSKGETIMPTSIIAKPGAKPVVTTTAPKATDDEVNKVLMAAAVGHTEEELITKVASKPEVKATGLGVTDVLRIVDKLTEAGSLVITSEKKYQLAG
jgi:hypothetical protein